MPHFPEITVLAESAGWERTMRNAIDSRNCVKVIIRGTKATNINLKMIGFPDPYRVPSPPAPKIPAPYPKLVACLTPSGFGALANLLTYAAGHGYGFPKVLFDPHGNGQSDDEFLIELR